MKTVTLAKTAGFCFGVSKAVDTVEELLAKGERVCTLGPIIHNPQVVEGFAARGVRIVSSPDEVRPDEIMVIRSHGVARQVYEQAQSLSVRVCDATCPFVSKIHRLVSEHTSKGAVALIAGDPDHPEVKGICGHCVGKAHVFASYEELVELTESEEFGKIAENSPVVMVAQTTFHLKTWEKSVKFAKKHYTNLLIFDTICNATANRQNEAAVLSSESDVMVIVGGRQSSNTAKLRDVCAAHCPTFLVETAAELSREDLEGAHRIGVTAGASTPDDIIKEVLSTMSELVKNETTPMEVVSDEMSFEEALDATFPESQLKEDSSRVRGIVTAIAPNEVQVEVIGRKQTGYIPADELSADPNAVPADLVKIGDELELLIMRTNDQEGTIMLSKKRIDSLKGWDTIVAAEESGEILEGVVADVIKGGILVVSNGVRVFVPASQASASRLDDLSVLLKTTVKFRVIEINASRRRAVGSVRSVSRELRKEQEAAFWAQAAVGQVYTGTVKSLTSYGAFVDIGGVDGMVHISELSWKRVKHPSDVVSVGDVIEVYIRDLDAEKKKISLGYRKAEDNPWEIFKSKYEVGSVVTVKVVGMTTFGAFAQILPGVDGLIHISQIADHRVEKPQDELQIGQEVEVKITNVDYDTKKISLSIRALLAPAAEEAVEEAAEEAADAE
ncbi:MAG: bifunctional 4-hydroxy-3-methylbut-2-enyl diphosphate reductase/30S ribosomal protein S1 [Ruminococcaceae bacterium]|nr:bifunctional 4-hydroxy-3-methylbut-2-enyl diphosphate reductase/30S ribosomal protein S1 [Oscillospiraceae bacterium]